MHKGFAIVNDGTRAVSYLLSVAYRQVNFGTVFAYEVTGS